MKPEDLYQPPNAIARHYSRFRVDKRLLLTGHSHQAWPDCGFDGHQRAWLDAAEYVDAKWERAFAEAERVRRGYASMLDDDSGLIALSSNTHDLVIRFLSAVPLRRRPRLVTTDGEYHTIRRQLQRLEEEGVEVVRVLAYPADSVAERLARAVDDRTAAVMTSAVLYQTGHIVRNLGTVMEACRRAGSELFVDAYHAVNVVPFSLRQERLQQAFVVGGGYKYCQGGEGNCFLRFPKDCEMRPVITGWFSEFSALADAKNDSSVPYGSGSDRFAGSTYDPTSHYRAAAVFDFFEEQGMTPAFLRDVSQHQVALLAHAFDELDVDPAVITRDRNVALEGVGGFLALQAPKAVTICQRLRDAGVFTDYRVDILRLGPAPYLNDSQLKSAMDELAGVVRSV